MPRLSSAECSPQGVLPRVSSPGCPPQVVLHRVFSPEESSCSSQDSNLAFGANPLSIHVENIASADPMPLFIFLACFVASACPLEVIFCSIVAVVTILWLLLQLSPFPSVLSCNIVMSVPINQSDFVDVLLDGYVQYLYVMIVLCF